MRSAGCRSWGTNVHLALMSTLGPGREHLLAVNVYIVGRNLPFKPLSHRFAQNPQAGAKTLNIFHTFRRGQRPAGHCPSSQRLDTARRYV
jgi:hypothetical protein